MPRPTLSPAHLRPRRPGAGLVALALVLVAAAASAVEPEKLAASLARQAAQAEESGDPARAAELFLEAFGTDAHRPAYLYAAARAEMAARRLAEAEEHLEQFLQLTDDGTERGDKARAWLAELRQTRAESREAAADAAAAAGQWAEASRRYLELWQHLPTRWSALYKAGSAAQQAGDKDRALELLRQYLRDSPRTAADRPEAEDRVQRLAPTAAPVAAAQAEAGAGQSKWPAWALLGGGAALVGVGAGLLIHGVGAEQALNREFRLADGNVTGDISYAAARRRADGIALEQTLGLVCAGAGLAAAGVGTWLALREPERAAALRFFPGPTLAGAAVGWRF